MGTFYVVGCGGITFHALPELALMVEEAGAEVVVCVDPDQMEAGNERRQLWGAEGMAKADSAAFLLRAMLLTAEQMETEAVAEHFAVSTAGRMIEWGDVVVCAPDNHECRREVVAWSQGLVEYDKRGAARVEPVVLICGNETDFGGVVGYRPVPRAVPGPMRTRHPELFKRQADEKETASCSADQEQSALGNALTAVCLWKVWRSMRDGPERMYVEAHWEANIVGRTGRCRVVLHGG